MRSMQSVKDVKIRGSDDESKDKSVTARKFEGKSGISRMELSVVEANKLFMIFGEGVTKVVLVQCEDSGRNACTSKEEQTSFNPRIFLSILFTRGGSLEENQKKLKCAQLVEGKKPKKPKREGLDENGDGLPHQNAECLLPMGTDLTTVAEILDIKKGEVENILADVLRGPCLLWRSIGPVSTVKKKKLFVEGKVATTRSLLFPFFKF